MSSNRPGPRRRSRGRPLCALVVGVLALGGLDFEDPGFGQEPGAPLLRVGTSGDYPPFSLDGEGFEVDVAEVLAESLGYRLQWVPFRWPDLGDAVARGDFDIAMSGITWRASRAVIGWMSRAVAAGGPCVVASSEVGLDSPERVAVNRGGILETWARSRFSDDRVQTVDDNLRLPELLSAGTVAAFVTDSFEVRHFAESSPYRCEPAVDRKVYWISPAGGEELASRVDEWLETNESLLDRFRLRHFGESARRTQLDHLIDLLARRLAFMPSIGAWKRERGLAVEDSAQEARVLAAVLFASERAGLDPIGVSALFEQQIDLAKRIQVRSHYEIPSLDLGQSRAVLGRLGSRIVEALAGRVDTNPEALQRADWSPLSKLLQPDEINSIRSTLAAFERAEIELAVATIRAHQEAIERVLAALPPPRRSAVEAALESRQSQSSEPRAGSSRSTASLDGDSQSESPLESQPESRNAPIAPAPKPGSEDRVSRGGARACAALAVFDSNDDGTLSGADRFWRHFYLELDDRGGAITGSAGSEPVSLFDAGVRRVRLDLRGYVGDKGTVGFVETGERVTFEVVIKKRRGSERRLLVIDASGILRGGGPRVLSQDGEALVGLQPLRRGLRIELASGESIAFDC